MRVERDWSVSLSRRRAIAALSGMLATPALLEAQLDPSDIRAHRRVPGIGELVDVFDFEPVAFGNIPRQQYDFTAQSTDTEWTARRNRHAFDWVEVLEQPAPATAPVDTSMEVLGVRMRFPIIIAPTSFQAQLHPEAEVGMYRAATANGTLMAVSHAASTPQEDIAAAADGPRWIQIYPNQNVETTQRTMQRYEAAGARAIVVTVDQQATRFDRQENNRRLGGTVPTPPSAPSQAPSRASLTGPARYGVAAPGRLWYNWDFMARLRDMVSVPVLMKGLMTAEDARLAVDHGFDGIVVSNHGGRSLDYAPSTLEVLPEIVQEVQGRVPVLIDSGFRRGSDVFKALALGADAVCVGRATRWGLAAFGPAGVQRVLEILQDELQITMRAAGRLSLQSIDGTAVRTDFP